MKSKSLVLAALASVILATGCKQSNTAVENTTSDTNVTSTAENIKAGATKALAEPALFTAAKKKGIATS